MARKAKTPKIAGFARAIVAANLVALIAHHYRHLETITRRQRALEQDSKVRLSTIQRLMSQETGANLETLEALAVAFDLSLYQLLTPQLDVANPQVIKGAAQGEDRLYKLMQRTQRAGRPLKTMFVLEDPLPAQRTQAAAFNAVTRSAT